MAVPHVEDVLLWAIAQTGDRYIFGAEAKAADPDPDYFDCSELVEWACARAGVTAPDGAYNQWNWSRHAGLAVPVNEGIKTRGALLFVGDGTGTGRDAIEHVAWSLGDGTTIEARGSKWGVGTWPAVDRFDFAGLMPGVDYSPGHGQLKAQPEEDEMPAPAIVIVNGHRFVFVTNLAKKTVYCKVDNGGWDPIPGGQIDSAPAAAVHADNSIEVTGHGLDGATWIVTRSPGGDWGPWRSLGGKT